MTLLYVFVMFLFLVCLFQQIQISMIYKQMIRLAKLSKQASENTREVVKLVGSRIPKK